MDSWHPSRWACERRRRYRSDTIGPAVPDGCAVGTAVTVGGDDSRLVGTACGAGPGVGAAVGGGDGCAVDTALAVDARGVRRPPGRHVQQSVPGGDHDGCTVGTAAAAVGAGDVWLVRTAVDAGGGSVYGSLRHGSRRRRCLAGRHGSQCRPGRAGDVWLVGAARAVGAGSGCAVGA
jgi:hypothetical protein